MIDTVFIANQSAFNDLKLSNIAGWVLTIVSGTLIAYVTGKNIGKATKRLELKVKTLEFAEEKFTALYNAGLAYIGDPTPVNLHAYLQSNKALSQKTNAVKKLAKIDLSFVTGKQQDIQNILTVDSSKEKIFSATDKTTFDSLALEISTHLMEQKIRLYSRKSWFGINA